MIALQKSVKGSLRERSPGVWQVGVSLGRDPATHRYRYAAATVRGAKRDAQRAAAGLVSEADHGRIPLTKETFGNLLTRWLDHIEARGRAPKTMVENRRMASAITEELGSKDLQKLKGSDLDFFYDRLSRRGLSATTPAFGLFVLEPLLSHSVAKPGRDTLRTKASQQCRRQALRE